MINGGFYGLIIRGLVMALPIALEIETADTSAHSSPGDVLAVPIGVEMVGIRDSTLLITLVHRLLRSITTREDDVCGVVVEVLNLRRERSLIITDNRTSVLNAEDLSNDRPFNDVGLEEVRATDRLNVLLMIRILVNRYPFTNDRRTMRSPVRRSARLVILRLFT